jgi:hypothetical protein
VAELIYLIPRKYMSLGHILAGFGGFIIILTMIFYINYISFLGHCCLIIGLSGIYFSKTKNFRAVRKSKEKEGIEKESLNGISGKFVYVFYIITIVGILIFILQRGKDIIFYIGSFFFNLDIIGYLLLVSGLLILYFKKRKEYWYKLENLSMKFRLARLWKCKDCGNKFTSKIMQCPECNGKDLKMRGQEIPRAS